MISAKVRERHLQLMMLLAVVFPVLLSVGLSWYGINQRVEPFVPVPLRPITVNSALQLEALFNDLNYNWPPQSSVPAVAIRTLPDGLQAMQVERKKSLFFRSLLPLVLAENARLRVEREWLQQVQQGKVPVDLLRLQALADSYRIRKTLPVPELVTELLLRVDVIPPGLVLAQAANESGWGTSRFSREANNLFGEWTWDEGLGVTPRRRPADASHYVRRFSSLRQSVESYLHNLNSGHAYEVLRQHRAQMRKNGVPLQPLQLAAGLEKYSARGRDYVDEIRRMIRSNRLNNLGPLDLVH